MMHLDFLYTPVSWVLLRWHQLFTALGMPPDSGWTWTLSIMFVVITARLLLFRLFLKQVHYQRTMQRLQPDIRRLREKYRDDRPELNRQMMTLQQSEGFHPLAGCLPMVLQIPVFIGLYHVLRHVSDAGAARARIVGAPLAASFTDKASAITLLGGDPAMTRVVVVVLLIGSACATFATQLLVRANGTTPAEGTAATVQKLMLYLVPVGTLVSGLLFHFPLGVLIYWFTSNLWTLGQQAWITRFHPPADIAGVAAGRPGPLPDDGGTPDRRQHVVPQVGRRPVEWRRARRTRQRSRSTKR